MTETSTKSPSGSCKGISIAALVLGIVALIIELGYMAYLILPEVTRFFIYLNIPVLYQILFWGGVVLSIASDGLIGAAKGKKQTDADHKRLVAAEVLSVIFIMVLIANIIISITTRGSLF